MDKKVCTSSKRSTNFTAAEESLLIQLVKKYGKQIECAKSDTNTNKIKNSAWAAIEVEFNSQSQENNRDAIVLKNKYQNLKKRCKQKFAAEKKSLYLTGGGKGVETTDTDIDNGLREVLGSQMTGLLSACDDDIYLEPENAEDEPIMITLEDRPNINDGTSCSNNLLKIVTSQDKAEANVEAETSASVSNWAKYTPDMLKTPISKPLVVRNKNSEEVVPGKSRGKVDALRSKMGRWASSKTELVELQMKCYLEEQNMKLQLMKEKHERFLCLQEREADLKEERMKEEHALKMEILRMQLKK